MLCDVNTTDAEKLMYEQREANHYEKIELELATKRKKAEARYSARAKSLNAWRTSTGANLHVDKSAAIIFVSTEVYASFSKLALTQVQEYEASEYTFEDAYYYESDVPQKRKRRRMKPQWLRKPGKPICEPISSVLLKQAAITAYLNHGESPLHDASRRTIKLVALGRRTPLPGKPGNLVEAA